jgi:hypothetical protein
MFCAAAIAESQPPQSVLDSAFSVNEKSDTARLLEIVEAEPAILKQKNTNGVSLLEAIYLHYNDDLVAQSHLEFLEAFVESAWFGQEFDTEELFDLALGALRGVDRQLSDIALTPDMRIHGDRAPFIQLLSKTADAVRPSTSLSGQAGLEIILEVCDKRHFAVGQEDFIGSHLTSVVTGGLTEMHRAFVGSYRQTGVLSPDCVDVFLS